MQQNFTPYSTLLEALDYHADISASEIVLRRLGFRGKPHQELSFAELRIAARHFAGALCHFTEPNDRVLLAYPSSNDFVVAFLGCAYAGRIAVPVSLGSNTRSGERIAAIAQDCSAKALVSSNLQSEGLKNAIPVGCQVIDHTRLAEAKELLDLSSPRPSETCFLQYTSGSTGDPKGVIVSHENLAVNLTQILNAIGHNHTRIVSWLPQFHDMGLIGTMLLPVYAGMQTTYMSPLEFVQRPIRWLQALSDYQAQGSVAPNFGFSYLLERLRPKDLEGIDLSCVKTLMCGSEPINAEVLDRFVETLKPFGLIETAPMPTYGLAEATLMVTARPQQARVHRLSAAHINPGQNKNTSKQVACGNPASGLSLRILDDHGFERPDGIEGEIAISGPNVCVGYWGKPPHSGLLRTGDLGFIYEGDLFVTGRKKDLIILRGRNFYPTDIEALSEECTPKAGANSCAAIGFTKQDGSEALVIAQEIPASTLGDLNPEALRSRITDRVSTQLGVVPDQILLLRSNTVPRTTSGKVSRFALKSAFERNEIAEAFPKQSKQTGTIHA